MDLAWNFGYQMPPSRSSAAVLKSKILLYNFSIQLLSGNNEELVYDAIIRTDD